MAVDMTRDEIDTFMLSEPTLILCVNRPGKAPLPIPMGYGWKDGVIYMHSLLDSPKVVLLKKNPQVSIIVENSGNDYYGIKTVIIYGTAEVSEDQSVVQAYREIVKETKSRFESRRPHQWPKQLERFYERPRAAIKVTPAEFRSSDFNKISR